MVQNDECQWLVNRLAKEKNIKIRFAFSGTKITVKRIIGCRRGFGAVGAPNQ